ncbi:MAG: CBS domain-containing protein [Thermodesulfobacteriota bacterium]
MNVSQIMNPQVRTCRPEDSVLAAAKVMWEGDCGCAPVVDDAGHVVGMITDRDICMSGYLSGRPLGAIKVSEVMSKSVHSCRPEDSTFSAESIMRTNKVRRLPVVDSEEHLVGILSLNDIAREFKREQRSGAHDVAAGEVAETLACICEPRQHEARAAA